MRNLSLERYLILWIRVPRILSAVLLVELGLMAVPDAAMAWTGKPLVYVTNFHDSTVAVIDSGDNLEVQQIPVGSGPLDAAVAPDGNHVYVANSQDNTVSVIDTTNKKVPIVTTVPVGNYPAAIAVTPDGTHVYVTNDIDATVSSIDTTINRVVGTITVGLEPEGIKVTPDGSHVYVADRAGNTVSVIDTANNTVVSTIAVAANPEGIAVTPDGTRAYVVSYSAISVIDTATNTVVGITTVGGQLLKLAVTPDGKHVYITDRADNSVLVLETATNILGTSIPLASPEGIGVTPDGTRVYVAAFLANTVSAIDVASNQVVANLTRFNGPVGVGIVPPTGSVPPFKVDKLDIRLSRRDREARDRFAAKSDSFDLESEIHLTATEQEDIHPDIEPVKVQVGPFLATVPPGSFTKQEHGSYGFEGFVSGVFLDVIIEKTGTLLYSFHAKANNVDLTGVRNPVQVSLNIGDVRRGLAYMAADIDQDRQDRKD
jgi:YVTN family beta-propeller protein